MNFKQNTSSFILGKPQGTSYRPIGISNKTCKMLTETESYFRGYKRLTRTSKLQALEVIGY